MNSIRIPIVLAMLALPGCVAMTPEWTPTVTAQAAGPVPFSASDCDYVEMTLEAPWDAVAAFVPAPFEARKTRHGTGLVLFGGADCPTAQSGTSSGSAKFGWTSVQLVPPANASLRGTTATFFLYRLEHFVVDGDLYRTVADAVGAERVNLDRLHVRAEAGTSALELDGPGIAHRIDAVPTAPGVVPFAPLGGVRWREFGIAGASYAILEATLDPADQANNAAVARLTPGTVPAQIFGTTSPHFLAHTAIRVAVQDGYMLSLPR